MSKQLHYCNKTVTSEQFQSGGTEGLQVTRADCSHRQNFERERVYVRIITDCRLVRICLLRSNLIEHLTGIFVLFFFFFDENSRRFIREKIRIRSGFFATLCLDGADSVSTTTIFTRFLLAELTSVIQTRRVRPL